MIPIRNVYHMLAYAFQTLKGGSFVHCATEEFSNATELLSAILCTGVGILVKQGIEKDYTEQQEELSTLRGKPHITASVKQLTMTQGRLVCVYDEFSENTYHNQIIHTTLALLLRQRLNAPSLKELRRLLPYFRNIGTLSPRHIEWRRPRHRVNRLCHTMVNICELIITGLLPTEHNGSLRLQDFINEQQMCRLYEKFILHYFKKHHPELKPRSERIDWALDGEAPELLPGMYADIILNSSHKTLIIDAKYYENNTTGRFEKRTLISPNLYQVSTYIQHYSKNYPDAHVEGMLLYARTDQNHLPNHTIPAQGGHIHIRTLNLNVDFSEIANQLDAIAKDLKASPP